MDARHVDLCPCFACTAHLALNIGDILTPKEGTDDDAYARMDKGNIQVVALCESTANNGGIWVVYFRERGNKADLLKAIRGNKILAQAHTITRKTFGGWGIKQLLQTYSLQDETHV